MSLEEAKATIKMAADKKGITKGLEAFMAGTGNGNTIKPLPLTQNQYDALFSYFYANGPSVFEDGKYDEWKGYGGEHADRAEARMELRDYLISKNGNYNAAEIERLFISSKGANVKYEYYERRKTEATVFAK